MIRSVALTAELIEAFAGTFLSPRYDQPVSTPAFHRQGWAAYCSPHPQVTLVAPRESAKSTAFTFDYCLAEICFRTSSYIVLVSSTEEFAAEQLSNIRGELVENEDLQKEFGITGLEKDSSTDIIVKFSDGHRARVLARGSEQRIRGRLWMGKRPDLLLCDDMEDDEQVENKERRMKFRRWFFRAAKQALGRGGRTRAHGTILHEDSLLARLQKNKTWKSLFFKAHASFDDFSKPLWPEAWPEKRLRDRRQEFIEDGDSGGYAQEFLNDPQDNADAYLRRQDFLPMTMEDHERQKRIGVATDFAVSKADLANRTSFTIGGICTRNLLHILDERVDRWASVEILPNGERVGWIEEMFSIQARWEPEFFWVEDGVIWQSIKHLVYDEMREKNLWLNILEIPSTKDKAIRGRTLQKRMRAGGCRFNKEAEWYPGYETELLRFTGGSQATLDDQFDSSSLLAIGFDKHMGKMEEEDFMEEEELSIRERNRLRRGPSQGGRSLVTGY